MRSSNADYFYCSAPSKNNSAGSISTFSLAFHTSKETCQCMVGCIMSRSTCCQFQVLLRIPCQLRRRGKFSCCARSKRILAPGGTDVQRSAERLLLNRLPLFSRQQQVAAFIHLRKESLSETRQRLFHTFEEHRKSFVLCEAGALPKHVLRQHSLHHVCLDPRLKEKMQKPCDKDANVLSWRRQRQSPHVSDTQVVLVADSEQGLSIISL